jgi:tetratricopeptide (TPR) repeat protein
MDKLRYAYPKGDFVTPSSSPETSSTHGSQSEPTQANQTAYGRLPASPSRGFVGRSVEQQQVCQSLASGAKARIILLYGAEGIGKTTLAVQVAHDLVSNGRFAHSVYSDFLGGGQAETALYELGIVLVGETFDANSDGKIAAIHEILSQSPTLLIWDHLEALLPEGDAPISDLLLRELVQLGSDLVIDTDSRLIMIAEKPLPGFTFSQGIVILPELEALSADDALQLLQSVRPETLSEEELKDIVRTCSGQPIAINLMASLLHHVTLPQVFDLIDQAVPGARSTEVWGSLQVNDMVFGACWQTLTETARAGLYGLCIFSVGGMERLVYQLEGIDAESWQRFRTLTTQAGLVTVEQVEPLAIPYLRIHPILMHYALRHFKRETRAHLYAWYCGSYLGLLKWITEQQQRLSVSLRFLLWRELPNFRRAFRLLLSSQQLSLIQEYNQVLAFLIQPLGLLQEIQAMSEAMQAVLKAALPKEGPLSRPGLMFVLEQVKRMIDSGKSPEALAILKPMCQRIEKDDQLSYKGDEAKEDRARASHLLGKALAATGAHPLALGAMVRALKLIDELPAPDKAYLLSLLCDLSDLVMAARDYANARQIGERALQLASELQDSGRQGRLYYELAVITYNQGDMNQTRQYASSALQYLEPENNLGGQAEVWRILATLSMQDGDTPEAKRQLQRALELARLANIPQIVADTLVRLGQVHIREERLADAETSFMQALVIFQEHNARPSQTTTEIALGEVLLKEGQVASARSHAEAARALAEGAGPSAQPWIIFDLLERIALAENDSSRALVWRRRARESLAESPQADTIMARWRPLLQKLAAVCGGEVLDDETLANLEKMEAEADNPELFGALWRILGGERGSELYESLGMAQSVLVKRLLDGIGHPEVLAEPGAADANGTNPQAQPEFTIDQFLVTVKAAIGGDPQAKVVTESFLRALSSEQAPQTLRDFANATRRILGGDKSTAVTQGLPPELARVITILLAELDGSKLN